MRDSSIQKKNKKKHSKSAVGFIGFTDENSR